MALTTGRHKRPSFSPPRHKVSKTTESARKSGTKSTKPRSRTSTSYKQKKSRLASATPSESDEAVGGASRSLSPSPSLISEPDFILAEVTHDDDDDKALDGPAVPLSLQHRMLHHNFRDKDKTRITTDAKEVLGKYVEVFVREAIARSAYESQGNGPDDAGGGMRRNDGFLEVEDLEKTGVQLVLDF
jgi:hypothetical protein